MVHADASIFSPNITKEEAYAHVLEQATALFENQRNWVWSVLSVGVVAALILSDPAHRSNLANTASLLWHAYKSLPYPSNAVNWAGFYTLDPSHPSQLILGPFQGKVACQTIAFGRGVCGTAAATATTQLVLDVEEFPGHIACDGESRSEIVVPVVVKGKVVAIIDVDCAVKEGFDGEDRKWLEEMAGVVGRSCNW